MRRSAGCSRPSKTPARARTRSSSSPATTAASARLPLAPAGEKGASFHLMSSEEASVETLATLLRPEAQAVSCSSRPLRPMESTLLPCFCCCRLGGVAVFDTRISPSARPSSSCIRARLTLVVSYAKFKDRGANVVVQSTAAGIHHTRPYCW
jgi:hypothetical protein